MLLRAPGLVLAVSVLFVLTGAWVAGCGAGSPSAVFFTSGLFASDVGANPSGGPLPDPDITPADDEGDGGGDGGDAETICIVWRNDDADMDVRVTLYASVSGAVSFEDLTRPENLQTVPVEDAGCIDEYPEDAVRSIRPLIVDGGRLSYQMTCTNAASLVFGVMDETGSVGAEDEYFGPLLLGLDFSCGDNLNLQITDDDMDDQPEISFQ